MGNSIIRGYVGRTRAGFFVARTLLASLLAASATAQTFAPVYSFTSMAGTNGGYGTNGGGSYPTGGLAVAGNSLYGTAEYGGRYGYGSVFTVNADGTGFRTLHSFTAESVHSGGYYTNVDGAYPYGGLVLVNGVLYGTAAYGGSSGAGTVFKISTNGSNFVVLKNFYNYNGDGGFPMATLAPAGAFLYGTTSYGGSASEGTIFKINTNGGSYQVLHSFSAVNSTTYTNVDGAVPQSALTVSGNFLYGAAQYGGDFASGTLFKINVVGGGLTVLHHFTVAYYNLYTGLYQNSDGFYPLGQLLLIGTNLYGTANQGGAGGAGTVFMMSVSGTEFTTLNNFYGGSDGGFLNDGVVLSGSMLYGTTTSSQNSYGYGTLFGLDLASKSTSALTTLYSFTDGSDGGKPLDGLTLAGGVLYGTAEIGGAAGTGALFSVSLPPPPSPGVGASGTNIILTLPADSPGYFLQYATNVGSPSSWSSILPSSAVVESNKVIIPASGSGAQMFFRLSR